MKKKKMCCVLALLVGTGWMASCGSDDVHQLGVIYPNGVGTLYADETEDSIGFITFDSWTVTPVASWMKVEGNSSGTIKHDNNARYYISVPLTVEHNTSGHSRMGTVQVYSYEYAVAALYYQMGTLNISHPSRKIVSFLPGSNNILADSVAYEIRDSAYITTDSICFDLKRSWSMAFKGEQPEWLTLSQMEGDYGHSNVTLTMEENPDTIARVATVILTSSGISNEIDIRQLGVKKLTLE